MDKLSNYKLDIEEWQRLKSLTKNQTIIQAIDDKILSLQRIIEGLQPSKQTESKEITKTLITPIDKYAWDQTTESIKIYLTIPGVGELDPSEVVVKFEDKSLEIKVDYKNGGIRRCYFNLNKEIDPIKSRYVIKKDSITVTLKKIDMSWWTDLRPNEKINKNVPKLDDSKKDPGASLMDLMKNLYNEGDDEMKRTIAKAWTESQQKQGQDILN